MFLLKLKTLWGRSKLTCRVTPADAEARALLNGYAAQSPLLAVARYETEVALQSLAEQWVHFDCVYFHTPLRTELGLLIAKELSRVSRAYRAEGLPADKTSIVSSFEVTQANRIRTLLSLIVDDVLTELWNLGTYKAMLLLLNHNLVHIWEPRRLITRNNPEIENPVLNLTSTEIAVLVHVAKSYPLLNARILGSTGDLAPNQIWFNPYESTAQAEDLAKLWRISVHKHPVGGILANHAVKQYIELSREGESLMATARRAVVTLVRLLQEQGESPNSLARLVD